MIGLALAIRFQLLPEVVDLSLIPTISGLGGMVAALTGAVARLDPERLARLVVFGNLVGGIVGAIALLAGIAGVFS